MDLIETQKWLQVAQAGCPHVALIHDQCKFCGKVLVLKDGQLDPNAPPQNPEGAPTVEDCLRGEIAAFDEAELNLSHKIEGLEKQLEETMGYADHRTTCLRRDEGSTLKECSCGLEDLTTRFLAQEEEQT